jgi:hypothetical protein
VGAVKRSFVCLSRLGIVPATLALHEASLKFPIRKREERDCWRFAKAGRRGSKNFSVSGHKEADYSATRGHARVRSSVCDGLI